MKKKKILRVKTPDKPNLSNDINIMSFYIYQQTTAFEIFFTKWYSMSDIVYEHHGVTILFPINIAEFENLKLT